MSSYTTSFDVLVATSSVTIPFYQLTLPVAESISAEFIYNYYTRDEGLSEVVSLDAVDAESDSYSFILENWEKGTPPRQVKLSITSRDAYTPELLNVGVLTSAIVNGKIVFEDAPFDTRFSSILAHDTSIDEKIYNIISGSSTDRRKSKRSEDFLNIAKFQSEGYRFSRAGSREQVQNLYRSDIKSVNLGISLNNLFIHDFLKTAEIWQTSAFMDEFLYVLPQAKEEQDEERLKSIPTIFTISENEMDLKLESYSSIQVSSDPSKSTVASTGTESFGVRTTEVIETTKKVGYIIEKYGEQIDGSTLRYPDIIIEDPATTSYVDDAVRYGGVYNYKIRTVYKKVITTSSRTDLSTYAGYRISSVLIASTGVFTSVKCEEKNPPLPPNNISFQQTLSGLYIRWNFPINPQKDIKRFQIFRRPDITRPFTLIKELNFDKTIFPYTTGENVPKERVLLSDGPIKHYLDDEFNDIDSDFIYALCAIDAHGYSSSYSEQFRVRFDKMTGKLLISRISTEGAPKPYPNVNILNDFFSDLIKDSGHSRIRVYFDPEYLDITRDGKSLGLISATNTGKVTYKLSMTEINLGQSQTFNIVVSEKPVTQNGIPVSIARFYKAS